MSPCASPHTPKVEAALLRCSPLCLRLFFSPSRFLPDVDALLKKSEAQHEQPEDGCPFGPLPQRLLQALVEVRQLRGAVLCGHAVGLCHHGPVL